MFTRVNENVFSLFRSEAATPEILSDDVSKNINEMSEKKAGEPMSRVNSMTQLSWDAVSQCMTARRLPSLLPRAARTVSDR